MLRRDAIDKIRKKLVGGIHQGENITNTGVNTNTSSGLGYPANYQSP